MGPGLITGAADDDPSGIATYSQAGAQFGFNMLWTMVLTYPLMSAVQLVSGEIGRVTGCGLAKNLARILPRWTVLGLVALLFVANTINIGANLAAMGAATQLSTGAPALPFTIGFAALSVTLQMFISYETYARYLKWLTLVLLAYVAVLFVADVDWWAAAKGLVMPSFPLNRDSLTVIVALLGTTISPYLLFWQSSQEVEEIEQDPEAKALTKKPDQAKREIRRIKLDTFVGMAVSNLVALAIIMSTAATLHSAGKTEVASAADVAEALRPLAGDFAFFIFSLGIIGTGLLSLPVLAGSAAYAFGEAQGWKCGLENKPWEAVGFYSVIGLSVLLGLGISLSSIDPIKALFWSAVINGFVAVPIMAAMMVVASRRDQMGRFTVSTGVLLFGWAATIAMGLAAAAMVVF
ncbi:putative cation uptake system protein [Mesorhizobium metallidurans STM 2683]|uniref:Putative cation uptake system protein n=1 Tax=Mesorhizobium metallidurans STM 2683 TaxID=1297569 RepID=M5END0_9HYPH|nr:Nramp family divalent metal transporter [Mesorhizobium metallidurans]CCV05663.1 putative cation uptake system protein [Mesorhizobium metallidurans STM 2683]